MGQPVASGCVGGRRGCERPAVVLHAQWCDLTTEILLNDGLLCNTGLLRSTVPLLYIN